VAYPDFNANIEKKRISPMIYFIEKFALFAHP